MSLQTTLKSSAATEQVAPTGDQEQLQPDLPASLNWDRLLDSGQTAKFLGISLPHLRRLYRAKRVPSPITIGYQKIRMAGRRADRLCLGEDLESRRISGGFRSAEARGCFSTRAPRY